MSTFLRELLKPHAEWRPPLRAYHYAKVDGGSTRHVRGELVDISIEDPPPKPKPDKERR